MRSYLIPPDTNEKEKIVGGILNLNQFLWLVGGFVLGLATFALMFPFFGVGALIFPIIWTGAALPFAVYKPKGLTLFQLLLLKKRFKNKTQKLPNKRKEVKW